MYRYAVYDAVGPCDVDVFKHTDRRFARAVFLIAVQAVLVDYHDLAGEHVAYKLRAQAFKRAGF